MGVLELIACVGGAGALGGLATCAIEKEFGLPHFDKKTKTWRPGWLGNVLVGAIAAIAVWGMYGPLSTYDLAIGTGPRVTLTVSQLVTSILVGLSGGQILTLMAQKAADKIAKAELADTLREMIRHQPERERQP
jgi:hypothetical protein